MVATIFFGPARWLDGLFAARRHRRQSLRCPACDGPKNAGEAECMACDAEYRGLPWW